MNIFFRISSLSNGGAEKVFLSLAQKLNDKCNVTFVVDNTSGKNYNLAIDCGFRVLSLNVKRTFESILPLSRLIEEHKPDLLLSALTDTNAAAVISNLISSHKTKVVLSEHAAVVSHWKNKSLLKKIFLWSYLIILYRFADKIVCVSDGLKSEIYKFTKLKNLVTIYNPIRYLVDTFQEKKSNSNKINLLSVGRVTRQKDILCALMAAKLLKERKIDFFWSFVGSFDDIDYKNELIGYVEKNGIENFVKFIDFTLDISSYYASCDVFVLTSAWEGFGNVIVEALQFGLPVVSTDCNYGPSEILDNGKYGYLVPVGDYFSIAEHIIDINNNNIFSPDMLKNRAKCYSEEVIAKSYHELFKKVVDNKN